MPDPQLALPVKHVQRGGKWVVVDATGKRVAGSGSFDDEGEARGIASSVNDAWKRAGSERKSKGSPAVTREARVDRLAGQIASLVEAKPFNPSLHPRTRTGEWAKKLKPAIEAAKKAGVDLQKAFEPHSVSPYTESHLGPGVHAERLEQRARAASAVLQSGTAIPDAVLHLPDEGARRERIVSKLAFQGGPALAKAQAEYHETPVADLEQLGGIAIDTQHPVMGQANANLVTRQLHFGTSSVTGDYRHELGHTLRASMSGKGGPSEHTPLTEFIAKEHQAAIARRAANIKAGKPKPPTEQEWENQLGIIDPRSLDSFEEFIAEHYRAYHRSVFRSTHPEVSDADPNALKLYRKNHPEMAKFWDAWYTAQLPGRVADPLTHEVAAALIEEAELEESVMAQLSQVQVASHGPPVHVRFDPRLHGRDRLGKFAEMFAPLERAGHGSTIRLPHDTTVTKTRLGRYRVTRPGHTTLTHSTPYGAAAHALGHVNAGEVEHGAQRSVLHAPRIAELEVAREMAMRAGSLTDQARIEEMLRRTRIKHGDELSLPVPRHNPQGRSHASIQHFRATHGVSDVEDLVTAVNRIRVQQRAAEHLPAASAGARADDVRPKLEADRVVTGYGEYRLAPHEKAQGVMRLLHDGKPVEVVGAQHGQHVLAAIHDEAMVRHKLATTGKRHVGGARFQVAERNGKHAVIDGKGRTTAVRDSADDAWELTDKLNDAVGSQRADRSRRRSHA